MVDSQQTVCVRNACKSFGSTPVLINLSMTVNRGTIYGLLGASGCGKTTLLSCVVGRKKLNSGEITVLGGTPGSKNSGVPGSRVGYMPQNVALVAEFTVRDAVYYFGRIFGLEDNLVEKRYRHLVNLLDLPPDDRFIKNCSGGQQRRISLAAALVNEPELLILDEPTVGVDPVLRERIWEYLIELTHTNNTAVVITTHYIEETRQSHKIGLLRGGKLLAEESPETLLTMFRTNSLEEVFLMLSTQQTEGTLRETEYENTEEIQHRNGLHYSSSNISMVMSNLARSSTDVLVTTAGESKNVPARSISVSGRRMKALLAKNWQQFYRNPSGLSFMLLFPILQMCAFFSAIGTDVKNVNVAFVNLENYDNCEHYVHNETAIPDDKSHECKFKDLGCRFTKFVDDPMIQMKTYNNVDDAMDAVWHGKVVGVLLIPPAFSEFLEEKVSARKKLSDEVLMFSQIVGRFDMSNRQVGMVIQNKLIESMVNFQKSVFEDCNFPVKFGEIPINFEDVYGHRSDMFNVFMIPGALITIVFFMGATNASATIITDRLEGVWDRSIVAGVSSVEIIFTHLLTQFLILVGQTLEILILTFLIYETEYLGSFLTMITLIVLQGLCGTCFGFWTSVVARTHTVAFVLTTGSFLPMIVICGLLWPLEGMPAILRWFSYTMPFTIPIISLRNIMKKGWSITHLRVIDGIGIEITWIIFLTLISFLMLKHQR